MSEFIRNNGYEFIYERLIMPARGSVSFSKAFNRSVTGTDRLTCCGPLRMRLAGWLKSLPGLGSPAGYGVLLRGC